ncbi:MAG: agmatinase family protein [Planctomycetota bacterium]
MSFDPNAPASHETLFGLPPRPDALIRVIPVPYEGTVSYGGGTALAPAAIRKASAQVDLHDLRFGDVWRAGIAEEPVIVPGLRDNHDIVGERIRAELFQRTAEVLDAGGVPAVLGGEHSVSLGAIEACAAAGELGVIQIDAHMDLRDSYEGHRFSHASVMYNALERCPGLTKLVQIGIRDVCEEEMLYAESQGPRIRTLTDRAIFEHCDLGGSVRRLFENAIADLPQRVYITLDIDGLDPSLCPSTGTPVPGGLSFREADALLGVIAESDRTVVGFDLVEVACDDGDEWDANVAARVLYKLAGCAASSRRAT